MRLGGRFEKLMIAVAVIVVASYIAGVVLFGVPSRQLMPVMKEFGIGEAMEGKPPRLAMVVKTVTTTATTTMPTSSLEYSSRLLVKTADLELEAEDPEAAVDRITVIVESFGGYIARLSISGHERKSASMIVKVPEKFFYDALNEIRKVGRVIREDVDVRDVTEQHIDLEARLRNLRAEEEWLLAAVDKAKTVQDLIMLEKELWRVRGEIERIEAQLKNLERMTSYSTISIWIRMPEEPKPAPSPWPKIDLTPILVLAVTTLIYIAYGLVFLAIVGAPIAVIAYLAYRAYKRFVKAGKG